MDNQFLALFPTAVGLYNLEKPLTEKEKSFIMGLERRPNLGNSTSLENYLLENKKLSRLKEFFYKSVNHYFNEVYQPMFDVSLKITQCWANFSERNQWHHQHAHPNSFISGVFYVHSNNELDKIVFLKPGGYRQIDIPHEHDKWNMFNSETWFLNSIENQLILFPSSLTHNVEVIETDRIRVSLSFNTFPQGIIGDAKTLTECVVEKDIKKGKK